jgi:hypothetical protein
MAAAFDDPIPLPKGRQLVTLKDAARYIQKQRPSLGTPQAGAGPMMGSGSKISPQSLGLRFSMVVQRDRAIVR